MMFSRIPINKNPLLTEWFNTGLYHGNFSAFHHSKHPGKHDPESPCRCAEMLEAAVEWLKSEEDWKVFITKVGWLAGFAIGRDQEVGPSLTDEQAEGDLNA
jgi:hypothetical protein